MNIENKEYQRVHQWLSRHCGKACRCENIACSQESKNYQWAKLRDKNYSKSRENFIQLCLSCHSKYDVKRKLGRSSFERFNVWLTPDQHAFLSKGKGSEKIRVALLKVFKIK